MRDGSTAPAPVWDNLPPGAAGPLSGIRILDLTTVVMGPAATQILGDLGADVIKVEQPGGDSMRWIGPARHQGMGPLYLQANRNKRSLLLDLKTPEDRDVLLALVPQADVLVSNIRPQALDRLGLDAETLAGLNPRLVQCFAVGYGAGGPNAGQAVYDDLIQAASGIAALFQTVDGTPRYAPVNICDRVVGLYLAIAISSALVHRALTGEGQSIEVPMFETAAQFVLGDHMGGACFDPPAGDMGYLRLLSRVRGPYPTRDGHLSIVVYTDKHWRAFTDFVGDPGLIERDPRFATQESRTRHAEDCGRYLAERMPSHSTAEWLAFCARLDIPVARVNALEDLMQDPHLQATGLFGQMDHPTEGRLNVTRFPVRFSRTPATIRRHAPNLGEHSAAIRAALASGDPEGDDRT